jgi:hypothetical protein
MWSFLNISLLWGACAAAVPVVLHLAMRRKPKQFEFPALRFVARRHEMNRRQLRLRHLILLALRMALIALAAFALSGPSVGTGLSGGVLGEQGEPAAVALVFDTSMRMEYRSENRTRLEAAKDIASWLLAPRFPKGSQVAVLDSRPGTAAFQVDLGAAKHRVRTLETAAYGQPLPQTIAAAYELLASSNLARKQVYVFTDLAQVAWPAEAAGELQKQHEKAPDVGTCLIDVGIERPTNFALGDLRLSGEILSSRSSLRVETELSAVGPGGKRTVALYLLEPDPAANEPGQRQEQKRGERIASVEPNGVQPIDFSIGDLTPGTHQGYVQILGEDGLAPDDRRFFTVEVKPAWRVLIAAPKPVGQYAVFLTQGLAPDQYRQRGQARFECTVVAQNELAGLNLEPFSAVALLDPKPLEPAVWAKLGDFVAAGRGLAVFLGRNADGEALESFNQGPVQDLLAGKLVRQAKSDDNGLALSPQSYEHPILAPLRNRAGSIPWFRLPVYRYWQLTEPPAGVHVVVRFSDDGPAILDRPLGKGRIVTMTTPVSDDPNRKPWNRLTAIGEWPFPALAQCTFLYLVGSTDQALNFVAGNPAVLQLNPQDKYDSYVLSTPDGTEVRIAPDLKKHELAVAATDQPGNYRVRAGGTAEGVDRGFSVNLAAGQTRLERISAGELGALFGPVPHRLARTRDEIDLDFGSGDLWDLFPGLILAVAVILGLEHVAANRFYKEG